MPLSPLDASFQLLGVTQENLTMLSGDAADIDDLAFSQAILDAQRAVLKAGNRIAALRKVAV